MVAGKAPHREDMVNGNGKCAKTPALDFPGTACA